MKICTQCKVEKSLTEFYRTKLRPLAACKDCVKAYKLNRYKTDENYKQYLKDKSTEYRLTRPDKVKDAKLRRSYGLTLEQYNQILKSQNNQCAICESPQPGHRKWFAVDHCHTTGKIRGLLCDACNLSLGKFKDSVLILQKAIDYLKK